MTHASSPSLGAGRLWWFFAGIGYLGFVLYGSLVPLKPRHIPLDQALAQFWSMPYLELGIDSRADWVANILLFIPLTFLCCGAVWPWRRIGLRILTAPLVLVAAAALSAAIEFAQIYFPPRTVSLNDIVAETAGAGIGIAIWLAFGRRALQWMLTLPLVRGEANLAQRLMVLYFAALFTYGLLPLDLTISPVEIYKKWHEGKVVLMPFTTIYTDHAQQAYDLVTDIAIWIPAAVLSVLAGRRTRGAAWAGTVGAAVLLEVLQLAVYSRVSDSTDIVTAALGAAIGVALVRPRAAGSPAEPAELPAAGALRWLLTATCWALLLAAVFWYPYDFNLERDFLHERVSAALVRVPFETYYFGTEFRAITEVLRKMLFFAPLGFLFARASLDMPLAWQCIPLHLAMLLLAACVATSIEAVQILLPNKVADFTDGALEFLGAAIGYFGSLFVALRLRGVPLPLSALQSQVALASGLGVSQARLAVKPILTAFAETKCPHCGSTKFRRSRWRQYQTTLQSLMFSSYRCIECYRQFLKMSHKSFVLFAGVFTLLFAVVVGVVLTINFDAFKSNASPTSLAHESANKLNRIEVDTRLTGAAAGGDAESQYQLGMMYRSGSGGVKQDYIHASKWLELAATQGHADAQYNIGKMYLAGIGTIQHFETAFRWFELAASQSHTRAMYDISMMLKNGRSVPIDLVKAYMWANISASRGDVPAIALRDILVSAMTPEQLVEGQNASLAWKPVISTGKQAIAVPATTSSDQQY